MESNSIKLLCPSKNVIQPKLDRRQIKNDSLFTWDSVAKCDVGGAFLFSPVLAGKLAAF